MTLNEQQIIPVQRMPAIQGWRDRRERRENRQDSLEILGVLKIPGEYVAPVFSTLGIVFVVLLIAIIKVEWIRRGVASFLSVKGKS